MSITVRISFDPRVTKRRYIGYTSWTGSLNACPTCIDGWNDRAHPFAWIESADEIINYARPSPQHKKTYGTRHQGVPLHPAAVKSHVTFMKIPATNSPVANSSAIHFLHHPQPGHVWWLRCLRATSGAIYES